MLSARIAFTLSAAAPAALGQTTLLLSIDGESDGEAAIGSDLDGDGTRELWIGSSNSSAAPGGGLNVHSGADGALLATWSGEAGGDLFGSAVEVLGDLDGDGVQDLAVGAPGATDDPTRRPYVQVRSGADGALLWRAEGPARDSQYGSALAALGDVDGDGVPDLAVAARGTSVYPLPTEPAFAEVLSGANGARLWRTEPASPGDAVRPTSLARYVDVDGDLVSELAVGFSSDERVELRSGASGAVLMVLTAPPGAGFGYGTGFGASVAARGDFDGDGSTDLVVGAPWEAITTGSPGGYEGHPHHGSVYVLSGAALDGPPLLRATAQPGETGFGFRVASIGDASGDGLPDLVTGNVTTRTGCCHYYPGSARVHSGPDGALAQSGQFGSNGRFAAAGDWDGDGLTDYLVSRQSYPPGGAPYVTEIVAGRYPWPTVNLACASGSSPCYPYVYWTGEPSAQSSQPFALHATGQSKNVRAFLLLGEGERFDPFGAGTLCVASPFARHFIRTVTLGGYPSWCPLTLTYRFEPGVIGQGRFAPGRTVFAQFFVQSPEGPAELGTSPSLRIQIWP